MATFLSRESSAKTTRSALNSATLRRQLLEQLELSDEEAFITEVAFDERNHDNGKLV